MSKFTFNGSATTGGYGGVAFYTSEAVRITKIVFRGYNSDSESRYVRVTIGAYNIDTYVDVLTQIGEFEVEVTMDVLAPRETNISFNAFPLNSSNVSIYAAATSASEKVLEGMGMFITSNTVPNCDIYITRETSDWQSSSGYVELKELPYDPWGDWERDEHGYPLNKSVWRKDNKNDGFPYIIPPRGTDDFNTIHIFTQDDLIAGLSYAFTADDLIPIRIVSLSTLGE